MLNMEAVQLQSNSDLGFSQQYEIQINNCADSALTVIYSGVTIEVLPCVGSESSGYFHKYS